MAGSMPPSCSRGLVVSLLHDMRRLWQTSLLLSCLWSTQAAAAESARVLVLPTGVGDRSDCEPKQLSQPALDPRWASMARQVDLLVSDAVEDAGMVPEMRIDVPDPASERSRCLDDRAVQSLAKQSLVLAPRLVVRDGTLLLRIVSAKPGATVMRLSTQEVSEKELDFRVVVMVSELLGPDSVPAPKRTDTTNHHGPLAPVAKPRSQGKGVLALTSAVWGGAMGYSLQRAGGSDDPRLTYPLILLGSAIGLGAALVAAEEWDLSVGEAWYLNAGMLWPTTSGLLLARSYQRKPSDEDRRYVYGLLGATAGLLMASSALTYANEITEGGAVLTHSSGAGGLLLGGLIEMMYRGTTDDIPYRGMGYGAGIGVILGGAAATQVRLSSSRVLFIDLSAGIGALTGAALGSPLLVFKDDLDLVTANGKRAWLGLVGGGAVIGAGVGWYLTRHWGARESDGSARSFWPYFSASPAHTQAGHNEAASLSAGVQGLF